MSNVISIDSTNPKVSQKYIKALKFRIYPTEEQKEFFAKSFGVSRKIYNEHLQERSEFYINNIQGKNLTKEEKDKIYKTFKAKKSSDFKKLFPYTTEVSDWVLQFALRNCDNAFQKFFDNIRNHRKIGKKKNPYGYPQFKSKKENRQSFQILNVDKKKHFDFNKKEIRIPKLGKIKFYERKLPKWFKIVESFGTCTIEKSCSGRYYISILCNLKHKWLEETPKNRKDKLGLDFSPKCLYVDSNNQTGKDFGYIPEKQTSHKKLRKLSRKFNRRKSVEIENSPRKVNSKNKEKARIKLAKFEEKIANRRKNFQNTETKRLTTRYQKITIEDLNLKGISGFLTNAKNMTNTSWGSFVSKLQQNGEKYSCKIVKAAWNFPSSQICHNCRNQNHNLTLKDRKWVCPSCGRIKEKIER